MPPTVVSEGGRLEADSLLKAGNMGTVLVMRDASNLDAAEVANSANRCRDGSEPDLQTWTSTSRLSDQNPVGGAAVTWREQKAVAQQGVLSVGAAALAVIS